MFITKSIEFESITIEVLYFERFRGHRLALEMVDRGAKLIRPSQSVVQNDDHGDNLVYN